MPCSCKSKVSSLSLESLTSTGAKEALPHSVLPGESCIFCAGKHLAIAWGMLSSRQGQLPNVLGELECARRHLLTEYEEQAKEVANSMCLWLRGDEEQFLSTLTSVLKDVLKKGEEEDPGERKSATVALPTTVYNPLVGLIHICCAYRLAREIGYAFPNKGMIIGTLALAGENLNRTIGNLTEEIRNIRHKVQTTRASYMDEDWQLLCTEIWNRVAKPEVVTEHMQGCRTWLGIV